MDGVIYHPIGIIHTPFETLQGIPIQPSAALDVNGWIEVYTSYADGLKDLAGFSHIILIYHLHQVGNAQLVVTPFVDSIPRGVFATRAPVRPNPIGLSIVELRAIEGTRLDISNVDVLNRTPLLDIKPYIPQTEHIGDVRIGWLSNMAEKMGKTKSDNRFG